jgi:hypothetical protein
MPFHDPHQLSHSSSLQQWYAIKNVGSWLTVIMPMTSEENMAW